MPIYHFDFYRVFKKEEIIELGYEEYFFAKGVCLIEWAERAEGLYPEEYLRINIRSTSHSERKMEFCVYGEDYHRRFSGIDLDNI